jgi:hypothetical protein
MVTLRVLAPVTSFEHETLLDGQAWYMFECHGPVCLFTNRHDTTVVLVLPWAPFFLLFCASMHIFLSTINPGPLIYKGFTAKKYKKSNILSFYLLFASTKSGESALSNGTKNKFNDATFDFLVVLNISI